MGVFIILFIYLRHYIRILFVFECIALTARKTTPTNPLGRVRSLVRLTDHCVQHISLMPHIGMMDVLIFYLPS
jgi:hypothetical protein